MSLFTANAANTGVPNFKAIDIDPAQVAAAFQAYINRGSQLTGVSLDDIDCGLHTMVNNPATVTLSDLLGHGMKLFDAMVWLTAGRPASHPLARDPSKSSDKSPSMMQIAGAVFYVYFFLISQARYPAKAVGGSQPAVANFLREVMGMKENQSHYIELLCSFEPTNFDPRWVRHVSFAGLGQEVLSRFGLGVAGYRMFGPFKLYSPKPNMDPTLQPAYEFARKVASTAPTWDIHPLTRNPAILTVRGNLNKNLNNLILECFDDVQIAEMVTARVLFKAPTREPNYMNYKRWIAEDDISGTSSIFLTI